MKTLSIDIETYSSVNLAKSGVYRYAESPDFEILLFGYSADGAPVKVVDLAAGETLPADVRSALTDPAVTKWAFNAQFERVCLSRYLGYPTGRYLDPSSWHCTMVWAATLGLPLSLEGVGAVLGLEKQKLKEGKDLIRYFCTPFKTKDGTLIRHYPADAPEKWSLFKAYNLRDVETEMGIQPCPATMIRRCLNHAAGIVVKFHQLLPGRMPEEIKECRTKTTSLVFFSPSASVLKTPTP